MKISIYQPRISYYKGGGEVVPLQQAKWLSRLGNDVTILTTKSSYITVLDGFEEFCENNNVKVDYLELPAEIEWLYKEEPGENWSRWDLESLHVGRLAYEYYLKNKFDIVAVHNLFDIIAVPLNQKSVTHLHGTPLEFEHHHSLLATLTNRYIAVSSSVGIKWQELLSPNALCTVIKNGVDVDFFNKKMIDQESDILFIGRLLPVKGVDSLFEAVKYVKDNYALIASVVIAGTGPEEIKLKNLVKELGIEDQITFLGFVEDSMLPLLYSSSRIGVFPSKSKEGVLSTMLEAASCSLPIISTNIGGIPEFLKNERNGILVQASNTNELGDAIYRLLNDKVLSEELGYQARLDILKEWGWESRARSLQLEYENIIKIRSS